MLSPKFNSETMRMEYDMNDIQNAVKIIAAQINETCIKHEMIAIEKEMPLSLELAKKLTDNGLVAIDAQKKVPAYQQNSCLFKEQPCKEFCEALYGALTFGIMANDIPMQRSAAQLIRIMQINEPKHESHVHFSEELSRELHHVFTKKETLTY